MIVREGGLGDPQVEALLHRHRSESHASTPIGNAHALDSSGLAAPGIDFFSAWEGADLLGIGALKRIDAHGAGEQGGGPQGGELKSMRTAPGHLRTGVARAILDHLVGVARTRGLGRLYLETGTAPMFDPANRLYERYGFVDCAAFGGYPPSPHNRFMMLVLTETRCPPSS